MILWNGKMIIKSKIKWTGCEFARKITRLYITVSKVPFSNSCCAIPLFPQQAGKCRPIRFNHRIALDTV